MIKYMTYVMSLQEKFMSNLFLLLWWIFYFNEWFIIHTLNNNKVLQPWCFRTSCSLPTLQRYLLQLMEITMLWTICLENTLLNMIKTCKPKSKLVLKNYKTWKKHKNQPKTMLKYTTNIMSLWETLHREEFASYFLLF
jgi:hypothetical protein